MSTPRTEQPASREGALEYLWGQFRVWDETAERQRKSLDFWRPLVLGLGILGGLLGALSAWGALPFGEALARRGVNASELSLAGGVLLGLSALFTRELLSPERESRWVRARAAAESFKREAYLMAAKAPPYDAPVNAASLDRAKDILATTADLQEASPAGAKKGEGPPPCPMSAEQYARGRLDDQVSYYRAKAARHGKVVSAVRVVTVVLGVAAVVLGARGGTYGVWLSLITAVISSLASYVYARRLQYVIVSYLAAARNLEALHAGWKASGQTDEDEAARGRFILECEKILSAENQAWISEWGRKAGGPAASK